MASITDYARMCKAHGSGDCTYTNCPLVAENNGTAFTCDELMREHPAEASAIIDKWCAEHPQKQKTYAEDYLETFPNADRNKSDTPCICRKVYYGKRGTKNCIDCWNEVMPEETGNE